MFAMFSDATVFNGDLSSWDVSSVTDMYAMFSDANSFNGDLTSWDVSSVNRMGFSFLLHLNLIAICPVEMLAP